MSRPWNTPEVPLNCRVLKKNKKSIAFFEKKKNMAKREWDLADELKSGGYDMKLGETEDAVGRDVYGKEKEGPLEYLYNT